MDSDQSPFVVAALIGNRDEPHIALQPQLIVITSDQSIYETGSAEQCKSGKKVQGRHILGDVC
jgi:hypothetical protein